MPIKVQHQKVELGKDATFNFGTSKVLSYVVGVSYWEFTLGSGDHEVQTLALSVQSNRTAGNKINSLVSSTLSDHSGHNILSSSVTVCCVALVDSADAELTLAGAQGINNGQSSSSPISLPSSNLEIGTTFLSGFNLSYGNHNHFVQRIWASAGFSANGTAGAITSLAGMHDSSGNNATEATINGGLIAATQNETGLMVESRTRQQTMSAIEVKFPKEIAEAVVLLQEINVQYPGGNHHVHLIGGGTPDWKVSGSTVTLKNARAFMADKGKNLQDDNKSNVSVVVVAVPVA